MATNQQMLDAVNEAILKIVSGSAASYTINNRTYTAHNLDALRRLRAELEYRIARETRGGPNVALVRFGRENN